MRQGVQKLSFCLPIMGDARSDIFSVGAMLYEMLTGDGAFVGARRDLGRGIEPLATRLQ